MEINDRIKEKAGELFRRYGVKSITMDEIASQLGVSKKTIYQSFADKNQLVDEVIVNMLDLNRSYCMHSMNAADNAVHEVFLTMESMEKLFMNMNPAFVFDIERGNPLTYKKFLDFKYDFIFTIMKKNIIRGKKEELYRENLNENLIAKFRLETMMLPFNEEAFPRDEFPLIAMHQELIEYNLFGMVTLKGYKLITKYQNKRDKIQDK
ncbi:MAG: TetR/AcrR family transcriptional regulator [Ginsengibacter sp.]|jgi:AcrR family transcriptional regulator